MANSVWTLSIRFYEANKDKWISEGRGPWIVICANQMSEGKTQQAAIREAILDGITFEQLHDCPIKNILVPDDHVYTMGLCSRPSS